MKKLVAIVLALAMCLALAACGGPDKQPAIDAFNKASTAFNEVAQTINADIESFDQTVVDTMKQMSEVLSQHGEKLSSGEEIDQETLDEMIAWYADVEEWVAEVKAELADLEK